MLNEISMSAKAKTKTSRYVFLGLLGTALIFVIAARIGAYSGILWSVAFCFIVAAIYVYNRFVGSEYYYEIKMDGGIESLVVSLRVGKTVKTLARVDLDSITEVRHMTRKERAKYKGELGCVRYSYFPTMFSEDVYLVAVRSEYEKSDILIEIDGPFASALTERN